MKKFAHRSSRVAAPLMGALLIAGSFAPLAFAEDLSVGANANIKVDLRGKGAEDRDEVKAQVNADARAKVEDRAELKQGEFEHRFMAPKNALLSVVSRIDVLASQMTTIGTKLEARISGAATTSDMTAAKASLADYKAKVADALSLSASAKTSIAGMASTTDQASLKANITIMQSVRQLIERARRDLNAARHDLNQIRKAFIKEDVAATTTAEVNEH